MKEISCEKCNSKSVRAYISVQMYVDASDYCKITKKVIAKKSTEIWGMSDRVSFACAKCMYAWGHGYNNNEVAK